MTNISNPSGSDSSGGSGGGSGSGSGNGSSSGSDSCPDTKRNEDKVDIGMHTDGESKENTTNNEMLYAINEEDFDDSDVELVQVEWQL